MNVLIDTNVLLSAALRDRLPERVVLHVAGRAEFRGLVTPEILSSTRRFCAGPSSAWTRRPSSVGPDCWRCGR